MRSIPLKNLREYIFCPNPEMESGTSLTMQLARKVGVTAGEVAAELRTNIGAK